jgi:hypothetical protein
MTVHGTMFTIMIWKFCDKEKIRNGTKKKDLLS